jgi:hypothetical protein
MRTFCFVVATPPTDRDYRRYGVERISARGADVLFWDITRLLNPKYRTPSSDEPRGRFRSVEIATREDLAARCREQAGKDAVVIDTSGVRSVYLPICGLLNHLGVPSAVFCANAMPRTQLHESRLLDAAREALSSLKSGVIRAVRYGCAPRYVLAGGLKSHWRQPPAGAGTRIVWAHALDFDIYLDCKERAVPESSGGDIVFLDEAFPLHPDWFTTGAPVNPYPEPREYYRELDRMLAIIESRARRHVVIAAHPRVDYGSSPDFFNGRRVVQGKTAELVAGASLVLAHGSTSVNFAVLFGKPVVFLMPEKVRRGFYGRRICGFAAEFGKRAYGPAELQGIDIDKESVVEDRVYAAYRENYIKAAGSPERYFWDIVCDAVSAPDSGPLRQHG